MRRRLMANSIILGITSLLVLLLAGLTPARTWYVDGGGGGDATTIQAGIDSAAVGDTVLVAPGTYTGDGNRDMDFKGKQIAVISEQGPEVTVIDCEGSSGDQHRAFLFDSGEDQNAVLSGFTITGGYQSGGGGAIWILGSSPMIANNRFLNNDGVFSGGAIYCKEEGHPTVVGNVFLFNNGNFGGAVAFNSYCEPLVSGNIFAWNTGYEGGAMICGTYSHATITENTFYGNFADFQGGAILLRGHVNPTMNNNIIAFSTGGAGITCVNDCWPRVSCCDIFANAGGDSICGYDTGGNFSEDPLFCDPYAEDLHLQETSPCVFGYGCGRVGALGPGCEAASVPDPPGKRTSWGALKALYR